MSTQTTLTTWARALAWSTPVDYVTTCLREWVEEYDVEAIITDLLRELEELMAEEGFADVLVHRDGSVTGPVEIDPELVRDALRSAVDRVDFWGIVKSHEKSV